MGVQRSMPPWLVALLVVVPCRAFPRVSRLTNEEIHQHVEEKGWAKTRVDKPEECDREKCPKMMDICPEGGHCYVTGDCGDDGCLCNIKISCQEKNDKESENQETSGNKIQPDQESENQEGSGNEFQPEVGSDYSDDDDDGEHHDVDEHHDEHHNEAKQGHQNLKHTSCLKNIHNESYCEGWKKATCDMKNMQACCDQAEWSRDWKTSCGAKIGTCEDYRIQHNDGSCCWRLTCPTKEGHDYMESSNEKPHRYEDKEEKEEVEEEEQKEEAKEEDEEEENAEENNNGENHTGHDDENENGKDGNNDGQGDDDEDEVEGDDKEVSEGDDEDESEGDDEEESEEVQETEEEVVIEEDEVSEEDEEETEEGKDEDEGEGNIDEDEGDVDEGEENNEGKDDNKVDEEEGKYDKEEENTHDGDSLVNVKGAGNESSGNDTWVKKPEKDLLSEGERISMKPLTGNKKGVQFRYCFKNPEECNEDYALQRCAQINLDYECSEKKTSCMFKHFKKDSKCCLRYECLGIDLPQEGEDYEEESVKREEDTEESKVSQDEARLANLESP